MRLRAPASEGELFASKAVGYPLMFIALFGLVVMAWHTQAETRSCIRLCEARGGIDHNFVPGSRRYGRVTECRCAFEEDGKVRWRPTMP